MTGMICALLHRGKTAFRVAAITRAIVMLVAGTETPWVRATHRFLEGSLGIAIALAQP